MSHYSTTSSSHTDGMAMNWVLDHVLTHPDPYQTTLPLRTIYQLNCQTASTTHSDFKQMLMEHLQNLPVQPCTLPPVFLTTFIKKCFPEYLEVVDFDQALTALDYLRDLELRRKKELEKAIRVRGQHDPKIVQMRSKSVRLDHLYAKALVGIRRWTLVNELSLPRFNKCNCVALLNTLYPLEEEDINVHLTATVLSNQRKALWKYIIGVEKNGVGILDTVRDANNWKNTSDFVHQYTKAALDMIQKAEDLSRPTSYGSFQSDTSVEVEPTSPKKSNVRRHRDSNESSEGEFEGTGRRSTLEKIVRGLAKLGGSGSSKKIYGSDWNASTKGLSRSEWYRSNDDIQMRYD
ncbi:hypothetical protein BDD12DRAFT_918164 [Trichophaea hybrida]|nr:hypothetical protein BDD12DRAFT_918164 [Trichophaea hybrida]